MNCCFCIALNGTLVSTTTKAPFPREVWSPAKDTNEHDCNGVNVAKPSSLLSFSFKVPKMVQSRRPGHWTAGWEDEIGAGSLGKRTAYYKEPTGTPLWWLKPEFRGRRTQLFQNHFEYKKIKSLKRVLSARILLASRTNLIIMHDTHTWKTWLLHWLFRLWLLLWSWLAACCCKNWMFHAAICWLYMATLLKVCCSLDMKFWTGCTSLQLLCTDWWDSGLEGFSTITELVEAGLGGTWDRWALGDVATSCPVILGTVPVSIWVTLDLWTGCGLGCSGTLGLLSTMGEWAVGEVITSFSWLELLVSTAGIPRLLWDIRPTAVSVSLLELLSSICPVSSVLCLLLKWADLAE